MSSVNKLVGFGVLIVGGFFFFHLLMSPPTFHTIYSQKWDQLGQVQGAVDTNEQAIFLEQQPKQLSELGQLIQKRLANEKGQIAIYIENLQSNEQFTLNPHLIYPTASFYKLIVMAATFEKIEQGSLKLDTQLTSTKTHLSSVLGSLDFGYDSYGEQVSFDVEHALTRISTVSDNFAAIMLTEKLRQIAQDKGEPEPLNAQSQQLGLKNTQFPESGNITTAEDMASFFKQLYAKQIVSKAASDKIIDYLTKAQINDRIPAKLPKDLKIAHKTAELPRLRHDGGLVYLEGSPYLIILMSKELQYEDDGVELLADLSQITYQYFEAEVGGRN